MIQKEVYYVHKDGSDHEGVRTLGVRRARD